MTVRINLKGLLQRSELQKYQRTKRKRQGKKEQSSTDDVPNKKVGVVDDELGENNRL